MTGLTAHVRVLQPHPGLFAFYDGRIEGQRFADGPNWVDDGALSLGIASYALVSDDAALVYDTHVSLRHARLIRRTLEQAGVRRITVVLSHCHLDHVAGTGAFADCEIIANRRTFQHLTRDKAAIEAGTLGGAPAIAPLILPTRVFDGVLDLQIGRRSVRLIEANIHSDDATVLWLADSGVLLAGDTVEDTVTYVGDPLNFGVHLTDIERLSALKPGFVLPNHGAPEVIAAGGYAASLLPSTAGYIRWLMRLHTEPQLAETQLEHVIAPQLADGSLLWFAPYAAIHRQNVARTLAAYGHG
jgi:glyoxylase-like metal-dependent hydrolase (beta-lactamase superfamily II)